jgi:hypothetical protein
MAKKSRRARRQVSRAAQPVRVARIRQPLAVETPSQEVNFSEEYHYVVEDLRRIAVTAFALLVLLIVLAILIA